jgi:hypothetical protein
VQLLQAAGKARLLRHIRHILQTWKVVAADQVSCFLVVLHLCRVSNVIYG